MDSIKRLTTEALQEVEDGNGYEALRIIVAAIEEIADAIDSTPGVPWAARDWSYLAGDESVTDG